MAAIRSRNTRPEVALRHALRAEGIAGYRCHLPTLPGKPDLAFTRWKLAVFVDGAFWHGHPEHFTFGKLGHYWDEKVARTQRRDRAQEQQLAALGYKVLRFWDFELKEDLSACVSRTRSALRQLGWPTL